MFGGLHIQREDNASSNERRPYDWLGVERFPSEWTKPRPVAIQVAQHLLSMVLIYSYQLYPGETISVRAYEKRLDIHPEEIWIYLLYRCENLDFRLETLTDEGAIFIRKQLT